ncbi:uncharacterized protein LOC114261245 [Camellia sinensis]|uniref:uncharacterized protein LOC114261245 n=1 Tax=Camellia sinensis TaxID=4442 RepID=UPI001035A024|nr:uncharacterized protein LOC114261245 [Camellia sinensis]
MSVGPLLKKSRTEVKPSKFDIVFSEKDLNGIQHPHTDALIVTVGVANKFDVKRVLIDQGSANDIMYYDLFKKLGLDEQHLIPTISPLVGFNGQTEWPLGRITLSVTAKSKVVPIDFLVVRFPTKNGVDEIRGDQVAAKHCFIIAMKSKQACKEVQMAELPDQHVLEDIGRIPTEKMVEDLETILVDGGDPDKFFLVGTSLLAKKKEQLLAFLRKNIEVFAWSAYETPGLDPTFACHQLNVQPTAQPVVQKSRQSFVEHTEAVIQKVNKLLAARVIREVQYPKWLSNTVVVKKNNKKWRVCVDFTNLNRACPKDSFPLPRIDQLVDVTAGHERMSFLDAYSGYHQISLFGPDQEKTAFISLRGTYCYKVMPFSLKNAGATYQRMVTKMFMDQLGKTMEAYIDDMVVKSKLAEHHLRDLEEVFQIPKTHKLRLNALKCAFGVGSGKFLGYMVTRQGIEVNPDQIKALKDIEAPRKARELQKLTVPNEELFVYLAVSDHAVSAVLIREEGKEQKPVYYVSKTLLDAETRYLPLEKLAYALLIASRKFAHHFQGHTINVLTEYPLKSVFSRADFSGRTAKWAVELGEFDIKFQPRIAIKAQGSGAGGVLISPEGFVWKQAVRLGWKASNNEAEYEALLAGPCSAEHFNAEELLVYSDSQLVVNQLTGVYETRDDRMTSYAEQAKHLIRRFQAIRVVKIGRDGNSHADALACLGSSVDSKNGRKIWVEFVPQPTVDTPSSVLCTDLGPSWMDPLLAFLKNGALPDDKKKAHKTRHRAARF